MKSLPKNSNSGQISIKQAAEILGVSTKTLRRWEARNILIPTRTSGGHRRYTLNQIGNFKAKHGKKKSKKNSSRS